MSGFFSINRAPRLGLFTVDAVTNVKIHGSRKLTKIPLESGAEINDHSIREPNSCTFEGAMSNDALKFNIDDMLSLGIAGLASFKQLGAIGSLKSLGAAYLSGSDGVRAPTAASFLMILKDKKEPINVFTGLITLENMVIETLDIERTPKTDNGFTFTATLVELMFVKSVSEKTNADDTGGSIKDKAASKVVKGQAPTEIVEDQSWFESAKESISSTVESAGAKLKSFATDASGKLKGAAEDFGGQFE